jgi:hypothetical protein
MGFVGDTDDAANDAFFPGWAYMFTEIGRERGWSTATRAQFEAMCSSRGAFLVGDPTTVRDKILAVNTVLGGLSRITFPWRPKRCSARSSRSVPRSHPPSKRHCARRNSVSELIAGVRRQSDAKRVLAAETLNPRTAFRVVQRRRRPIPASGLARLGCGAVRRLHALVIGAGTLSYSGQRRGDLAARTMVRPRFDPRCRKEL